MSSIAIAAIVVLGVLLAGAALAAAWRRRDAGQATGSMSRESSAGSSETAPASAGREVETMAVQRWREPKEPGRELVAVGDREVVPFVAPAPDEVGVSRRQFLNRSIVSMMGFSLAAFGASVVAFLWPQTKGGFGSKIRLGKVDEVKASIQEANGFLYIPEGKLWVTEYPADALEKAKGVYSQPVLNGLDVGLNALFQKCPHLGCRVPQCESSQWFECPCHGSRYNKAGEKKGGPAPRGMDHFATSVEGGVFVVDTGTIIPGAPVGTDTTGQEQEGPSCLGETTH